VFWGNLHRTILLELVKIFSVALVALTGLILMAGIISEAMRNGLGPMQILAAIPLMLPSMLPYTVPTTTLFATCIVYGRLSADNEILALKAAGVHILHVIWPAVLLGVLASVATMFLYLEAIPYTSFVLKCQAVDDVEELLYTMLRRDGCIKHQKCNYEIHIKQIQGRKLQDFIFKRRGPDGKSFDTVARAREAELHVDVGGPHILVEMWQCQLLKGDTVGFLDNHTWVVAVPEFIANNALKLRAGDMTWCELFEYEREMEREKQKISHDIDIHQTQISRGKGGAGFRKHVNHLINERKNRDSQISSIHNEWHMRPGFSLGCLCFALIGCPIGIWFSKSDYLSAFITCFLPIVTIYYPLMFCTINMARAGKFPPWMVIYSADILMLLSGLILFRRLCRKG
jgi:lipopolysaccharide export system permease protein